MENEENESKKSIQDFLTGMMTKQDERAAKQDEQASKIANSLAMLQSTLTQNQEDMKLMKRDIDANANKSAPAQTRPLDKDAEPELGPKKTKTQSWQARGGDEYLAASPSKQ